MRKDKLLHRRISNFHFTEFKNIAQPERKLIHFKKFIATYYLRKHHKFSSQQEWYNILTKKIFMKHRIRDTQYLSVLIDAHSLSCMINRGVRTF